MTHEMQSFILGLAAGAGGYLVVTFWLHPLLKYREIHGQVHSDLIYFANATNANGLNAEMERRMWERVSANRRHSADLLAVFEVLPWWYRKWLACRGRDPRRAAVDLLGLSNTFDHTGATVRVNRIRAALGLPET